MDIIPKYGIRIKTYKVLRDLNCILDKQVCLAIYNFSAKYFILVLNILQFIGWYQGSGAEKSGSGEVDGNGETSDQQVSFDASECPKHLQLHLAVANKGRYVELHAKFYPVSFWSTSTTKGNCSLPTGSTVLQGKRAIFFDFELKCL